MNIGLGESIGISNQSTYLQKLPIWPCPSTLPHDHVVGTPLYDSWYESPGKASLFVRKKRKTSNRTWKGCYLRTQKRCDLCLGFQKDIPFAKVATNQSIPIFMFFFRGLFGFKRLSYRTLPDSTRLDMSCPRRVGEIYFNFLVLDEHKHGCFQK